MATVGRTRSGAFDAASRALDAAIEAVLEGEGRHPPGTTFAPADLARPESLKAYRRLGPVSIVDADGNEIRLARDRTREMIIGAALVGLVAWIASRP